MRQFFNQTKNLQLRKEGVNPNGLSSYSTARTFDAYLKPMSRKDAGVNGVQWGKAYLLLCDVSIAIDAGDKVYLNETGEEWSVQATTIQNRRVGSIKYKESILILGT